MLLILLDELHRVIVDAFLIKVLQLKILQGLLHASNRILNPAEAVDVCLQLLDLLLVIDFKRVFGMNQVELGLVERGGVGMHRGA